MCSFIKYEILIPILIVKIQTYKHFVHLAVLL